MLSRRYLAAAVLASGLALTAAVPAVAAVATPEPTPSPAPSKVIKMPDGTVCAYVIPPSGRGVVKLQPAPVQAPQQAQACRKLVAGQLALPYPKGAPQTGGGGMAAEVSSWG